MRCFKMIIFSGALVLVSFSCAFAQDADYIKRRAINKSAKEILKETKHSLEEQAAFGVKATYSAISLIRDNKLKEAKDVLELASKRLGRIDKKGQKLLTVDVYVNIASGVDSPDEAENLVKQAKKDISENNLQAARTLLMSLVSEVDVSIVSVPLGPYKEFIDKSISALDKGNKMDAENFLFESTGLLVTETEVVPIPALAAQAYLEEANNVVELNPEQALELVKSAKAQLKLNKVLGYGDAKAYESQVDSIKRKVLSKRYEEAKKGIQEAVSVMDEAIEKDISGIRQDIRTEIEHIKSGLQG